MSRRGAVRAPGPSGGPGGPRVVPDPDRARAGLLRRLRACCPSPARRVGAEFLELWSGAVHRAWRCSEWELSSVLALNREVARLASGPEGEAYQREARRNEVRLLVRMGRRDRLPGAAFSAVEGEESRWLHWLLGWVLIEGDRSRQRLAEDSPEAALLDLPEVGTLAERMAGWGGRRTPGGALREGCRRLSREARGGPDLKALEGALKRLGADRGEERPEVWLRRLLALELARAQVRRGRWAQARPWLEEAGLEHLPEAGRLFLDCERRGGAAPGPDPARALEACYAARRARTLAWIALRTRDRVGWFRWEAESRAWDRLSRQLSGGCVDAELPNPGV